MSIKETLPLDEPNGLLLCSLDYLLALHMEDNHLLFRPVAGVPRDAKVSHAGATMEGQLAIYFTTEEWGPSDPPRVFHVRHEIDGDRVED